jgi:hypothetical protein
LPRWPARTAFGRRSGMTSTGTRSLPHGRARVRVAVHRARGPYRRHGHCRAVTLATLLNTGCREMPPNPAVKLRSNDLEAIPPSGEMASDLQRWSGRPDLNRRPLDPQDVGSGVIPAQSAFSVRALCSLTCGLFSVWHGVWSPDGPRGCRYVRVVDAHVSSGSAGPVRERALERAMPVDAVPGSAIPEDREAEALLQDGSWVWCQLVGQRKDRHGRWRGCISEQLPCSSR